MDLLTIFITNALLSREFRYEPLWTGFMPDSECGWRPVPWYKNERRYIFHDELGYRNSLPYPEDRKLSYIIQGDSNVYGFNLKQKETIAFRLTDYLGENVYNFGVSGYDVHQFWFLYRKEAKRFTIERRIILFNLGNDFSTCVVESPYYFPRPYLNFSEYGREEIYSPVPIKTQQYGTRFIPKYKSYNCMVIQSPGSAKRDYLRYISPALVRYPLVIKLAEKFCYRIHLAVGFIDKIFGIWKFPSEYLSIYYSPWLFLSEEQYPEPFKSYIEDLDRLMGEIKEQNPNVFIVCVPYRDLIVYGKEDLREKISRYFNSSNIIFDYNSLPHILERICNRHQIGFFDPTEIFLGQRDRESLYMPDDEHLSAKGIDFLAKLIAKKIKENPASCFIEINDDSKMQ